MPDDSTSHPAPHTPSRTNSEDVTSLSYEHARDALAAVVDRLQRGTDSLQESLDLWERGEQLARHCEEFLTAARARVDAVLASDSAPDDDAE